MRVFISGCYDIVHAGHIQFFREARALGTHLTVSFASAEVLPDSRRRWQLRDGCRGDVRGKGIGFGPGIDDP